MARGPWPVQRRVSTLEVQAHEIDQWAPPQPPAAVALAGKLIKNYLDPFDGSQQVSAAQPKRT